MEGKKQKKHQLSTTQLILLGFLAAVLAGSLLLSLPAAAADGRATNYLDALFTAATSVCVTGLTVVDTFSHWSLFGHIVILVLIQLGGLGIISFTTGILVLIGRKITLKDRILLESAFNLDTMDGLVRFLGKVFRGTLAVEGAGALLSLPVFVPRYGLKGIWISVFHSVSAFCNAGIDILGPDSLAPYVGDLWLNLVTMALIILGGLGFIVWWDVLRVWGQRRTGDIPRGQCFRRLTLHSKITIVTTVALILGLAAVCAAGVVQSGHAGGASLVAEIDRVAVSICHLPHGGFLNGASERTYRAVCAGQRGAHVRGRQFGRHGGRCQDLYRGIAGAVCRLRGAGPGARHCLPAQRPG